MLNKFNKLTDYKNFPFRFLAKNFQFQCITNFQDFSFDGEDFMRTIQWRFSVEIEQQQAQMCRFEKEFK